MKSLIRIHDGGQVVGTVKRVMHLDPVTFDWYITLNNAKVFVYPECDDSGDTYRTPYSREAAAKYTYHENCKVLDAGFTTRQAVYWVDGDTSRVWTLDGRPVRFDRDFNGYIVILQDGQPASWSSDVLIASQGGQAGSTDADQDQTASAAAAVPQGNGQDQTASADQGDTDQAAESEEARFLRALAAGDPEALKEAQGEEEQYLEQKTEAIMYRRDIPPVPSAVAWLWERRRQRQAIYHARAIATAEIETEPFTAF